METSTYESQFNPRTDTRPLVVLVHLAELTRYLHEAGATQASYILSAFNFGRYGRALTTEAEEQHHEQVMRERQQIEAPAAHDSSDDEDGLPATRREVRQDLAWLQTAWAKFDWCRDEWELRLSEDDVRPGQEPRSELEVVMGWVEAGLEQLRRLLNPADYADTNDAE